MHKKILTIATAIALTGAMVTPATAQDLTAGELSSGTSEASSRGFTPPNATNPEEYAAWTSSGAEMLSSGDPETAAEGSSRLALDWLIGAAVITVLGTIYYHISGAFLR